MSLVYENMPSREKKLKGIAKVNNFLSPRSNKPIANQFKIVMQNGDALKVVSDVASSCDVWTSAVDSIST